MENKKEVLKTVKFLTGAQKVSIIESKNGIKLPANVMVFQKFAYMAAVTNKLSSATYRVLLYIMAVIRYENIFMSIDIKEIKENLNITNRTIISSLNELKQCNIIVSMKSPDDARYRDYCVNPTAMWKGNSRARVEKLKRMNKSQQLSLFSDKDYEEKQQYGVLQTAIN